MNHSICQHAPSGCNYPEGECVGLCAKNVRPMNHSPLSAWADKKPYRWAAVSSILVLIVAGAYTLSAGIDQIQEAEDIEADRMQAQYASQAAQRRLDAVRDMNTGPEGVCEWIDDKTIQCYTKRGRKAIAIKGDKP